MYLNLEQRQGITLFRVLIPALVIQAWPQVLREWFCDEMGRKGVPDRYVDAFCGRIPSSVLARRYSDFAPEKLMEIYEHYKLKILN